MAKTNFTKAEEAMAEALQKLTVQQLLVLASTNAGTAEDQFKRTRARALFITALKHEIRRLFRGDRAIYKKLNVTKNAIEQWLISPGTLNDATWNSIVQLKDKVDAETKKAAENEPSDAQLVAEQRKKHINKRFNVSDKWLPLK